MRERARRAYEEDQEAAFDALSPMERFKARLDAFVNDNGREVSSDVVEALGSYENAPILRSHRNETT